MTSNDTPGLRWRKRRTGPPVPYWVAPPQAIKAGFKIKSWNLSQCPPDEIQGRCKRMWAEALAYTIKYKVGIPYDGTIASLINLYETHGESPFKKLKSTSINSYGRYAEKIARNYGERRVAKLTGLDVMRWHETWRSAPDGKPQHLAAATLALNVLKAALGFGRVCGFKDCSDLRAMISNLRLPTPKPREEAPDVSDVRRAMDAARALGHPSAAFAYALQFETAARQYDIVGQWVPLSDARPSSILHGRSKWVGPTWAAIDDNLILTLTPGKTENTTGKRIRVDLKLCPLVMGEIASIPLAARSGPLIIDDHTGRPFITFMALWARVRIDAGLRPTLWNRDLRAGGLTEGSMAGASSDDRAKLAGHSKKVSRKVYDRDVLVSSSRVNEARAKYRKGE